MSNTFRIILSVILSVFFLLFSYLVTNFQYSISGETSILNKFELVRNLLLPSNTNPIDSVLFIDVSFDRAMCPVTDEYGFPCGYISITDREKLYRLLKKLNEYNDYKYILMDVFFDKELKTSYDDSLYCLISEMPRIVIPTHSDKGVVDLRLKNKTGLADYHTTLKRSGFAKYHYMTDSLLSIPAKMYKDITGNTIRKCGWFYFDGNKLVRNSVVLALNLTPINHMRTMEKSYGIISERIY